MGSRRLGWLVALGVVAIAATFALTRTPPASAVTEVDEQGAIKAAQQFMQTIGVKPEPASPKATREIILWKVDWGGSYLVYVDVYTGKAAGFRNQERQSQIDHNMGRTGKQRFSTRADAEVFVRRLATKLGLPAGWTLDRLEFGTGVAAKRDEVQAAFAVRPHGYPFLSPMTGANGMFLLLDAQDGALKRWDFKNFATDPPDLHVNKQQAIAAAQQSYSQFVRMRKHAPFHGGTMNGSGVRLGYATTPESMISGQRRPMRLYWNVPFGTQPVWVDAETGKAYLEEIQLK